MLFNLYILYYSFLERLRKPCQKKPKMNSRHPQITPKVGQSRTFSIMLVSFSRFYAATTLWYHIIFWSNSRKKDRYVFSSFPLANCKQRFQRCDHIPYPQSHRVWVYPSYKRSQDFVLLHLRVCHYDLCGSPASCKSMKLLQALLCHAGVMWGSLFRMFLIW